MLSLGGSSLNLLEEQQDDQGGWIWKSKGESHLNTLKYFSLGKIG